MNMAKYKEIFVELWAGDLRFKIAVLAAVGFTAWGSWLAVRDLVAPPKTPPPAASSGGPAAPGAPGGGDPTKPPVPAGATAGQSGGSAGGGGVPPELAPKVRPGKSLDGVVIQDGKAGQGFGTAPAAPQKQKEGAKQ